MFNEVSTELKFSPIYIELKQARPFKIHIPLTNFYIEANFKGELCLACKKFTISNLNTRA